MESKLAMPTILWDGLAHQPVTIWQSSAVPRETPLGEWMRKSRRFENYDGELLGFRRALSQSIVYFTGRPALGVGRNIRGDAALECLRNRH